MKLGAFLIALCAGWMVSPAAGAEQYPVPGLGALQLEVPKDWRVREQPGPISVYLQIRPGSGDAFVLQVTSTWLKPDKLAELTPASIRERVERIAKDMLPNAVEAEAPIAELKGKEVAGYYFALSARTAAADPKQYRYLTQGMLSTSVGVTVFTLLHREPGIPERKQVLEMLAGAMHTRDAPAPAPLAADTLRVVDHPDRYELWVPASRVYVVLPRGRLASFKNPLGGSANNPRYFYFVDRSFNVSGWFEPAEKFSGVQKFWEGETRALRENGLPAPADVAFKKVNAWEAIIYDFPSPAGTSSHIRAHWVQAGTWIDIHLSLTSSRPSADMRTALETYLKGVLVLER